MNTMPLLRHGRPRERAAQEAIVSPEDDRPKSSERDDLEAIFRQVLYLSHRGQLELFELLAQRLGDTSAAPIEQVQSVVRQRETLEAMQQVAVALNLPEGRAPTTTQFNAQAKALGLDWNVSSVGRAFSKRQGWRLATQAFERGQLPETARQIRQKRYLAHRRSERIQHLATLREWLDSDPPDESAQDYARWRVEYNAALADSDRELAVRRIYFERMFPELSWTDLLDAARGRVQDVTELSRQRAEDRLQNEPNPLRLVGVTTAAALLGMNSYHLDETLKRCPETFPTVVATLGGTRAFLEEDLRAYAASRHFERRTVGELDSCIFGTASLSRFLGCRPGSAYRALMYHHWHLVPEPSGRYANVRYWLCDEVEAWVRSSANRRKMPSR